MERNFQYADLSRMESTPMCAVICRTAEEAEEFFYNVRSQFPDHLYWSLDNLMGLWTARRHVFKRHFEVGFN